MRAVVLAALVLAVAAGAAPGSRDTLPRATSDRPDDVQGAQIHFVYAIPSDGVDRGLDTSGAIESSVASFQRWLAAETGGRVLREDTYRGSLDITFVRLPLTDAELASRGAFVRDELERLLRGGGRIAAGKVYGVYYDGSSTFACGGGAWPPKLRGVVAAMYLRGRPAGAAPCDSNSLASPGAPPGYLDYGMLHELLHTLGAVPTCAPHHHREGHTSDNPDDLMWAGTGAWVPGRLDPGRDDYYGHGRSDCFDLARSPYLASAAEATIAAGAAVVSAARAGKPFTVSLRVTVGGEPAASGGTRCSLLRARTQSLRPVASGFGQGRALCRWNLPRTVRGQRLTGAIAAVVLGRTVTRSFSATAR